MGATRAAAPEGTPALVEGDVRKLDAAIRTVVLTLCSLDAPGIGLMALEPEGEPGRERTWTL